MGSSLDPFGLGGLAVGAVRFWLGAARWGEERVAGLFGDQRDEQAQAREVVPAEPQAPPTQPLSTKMQRLLDRALDQSTSSSRIELFHRILDQLVADEARIIGALSDGSASPLVNVHDWARRAVPGRAVLENASLIGRTANLALPDMVPSYVSHLLSLGLVEVGPEDDALKEEYEVLLAESSVLKAVKTASRGPLAAKVDKHTLRLSGLGHSLWDETTQQGER